MNLIYFALVLVFPYWTERFVCGQQPLQKSRSSYVRDLLQYTYPRGSLSDSISDDDKATPVFHFGRGAQGIPIGYNKTYNDVFVSSNGQILFGNNNSSPHPVANYTGPDMLAPYWTDLFPVGGGNGYVFYKTYSSERAVDQTVISQADFAVLYNSGNSGFNAKWILVVTWWNTKVVDFPADDRVTIQCILMTDFVTTYTIYNYMNVDVDPSHSSKSVAIGYKTNVRAFSNIHSLKDDVFSMSNFRGNTGERGVWFYAIADDNDCKWKPCQNGGTCIEQYGGYKCICTTRFSGVNCENDINECDEDPCVYGTCVNTAGSYHCVCRPGIQGQHCNQDANECTDRHLCENNGTCVNTIGTFLCSCRHGFTGLTCSFDSNKLLGHLPVIG